MDQIQYDDFGREIPPKIHWWEWPWLAVIIAMAAAGLVVMLFGTHVCGPILAVALGVFDYLVLRPIRAWRLRRRLRRMAMWGGA